MRVRKATNKLNVNLKPHLYLIPGMNIVAFIFINITISGKNSAVLCIVEIINVRFVLFLLWHRPLVDCQPPSAIKIAVSRSLKIFNQCPLVSGRTPVHLT